MLLQGPLPGTISGIQVSQERVDPAEMTDDRGGHRSRTDMSLFVKVTVAAPLVKAKNW